MKQRTVIDISRGRRYNSVRSAWEIYCPNMPYSSFFDRLNRGAVPGLIIVDGAAPANTGNIKRKKPVIDAENGMTWDSVSECAAYLKVKRQAIQYAIRNGSRCRGRLIDYADCTKE